MQFRRFKTMPRLALVDTIPHGATVFWRGHGMGWLRDETGRAFRYAVIPPPDMLIRS
jgi:hypothetical protein